MNEPSCGAYSVSVRLMGCTGHVDCVTESTLIVQVTPGK